MGENVRIYTKPVIISFCLSCESAKLFEKEGCDKFHARCMEFPNEVKEIDIREIFDNNFPEYCPLKITTREKFELGRGW